MVTQCSIVIRSWALVYRRQKVKCVYDQFIICTFPRCCYAVSKLHHPYICAWFHLSENLMHFNLNINFATFVHSWMIYKHFKLCVNLVGNFSVKMHHFSIGTICLLWSNAQERMRLEYCVTTQKKGFLKVFPMVSCFLIFSPWVWY